MFISCFSAAKVLLFRTNAGKIAEKNDWQSSTWKRKKKESLCNAKNSRTFASRFGGYVITCGGNAIRYRKRRQYNYRAYINENRGVDSCEKRLYNLRN